MTRAAVSVTGRDLSLTGVERTFRNDEILVSKTDPKGIITYANEQLLAIADYRQDEMLGEPHVIIRHPHMPRCVFKLLWKQIKEGREIFTYILNRTRHGDHYWVMAQVTPTFGADSNIAGFHSTQRAPDPEALKTVEPLYKQLRALEDKAATQQEGVDSALELLTTLLKQKGISYDEFILSL